MHRVKTIEPPDAAPTAQSPQSWAGYTEGGETLGGALAKLQGGHIEPALVDASHVYNFVAERHPSHPHSSRLISIRVGRHVYMDQVILGRAD